LTLNLGAGIPWDPQTPPTKAERNIKFPWRDRERAKSNRNVSKHFSGTIKGRERKREGTQIAESRRGASYSSFTVTSSTLLSLFIPFLVASTRNSCASETVDGREFRFSVERYQISLVHPSVVGFQCHRNHRQQVDLPGSRSSLTLISISKQPPIRFFFSNS